MIQVALFQQALLRLSLVSLQAWCPQTLVVLKLVSFPRVLRFKQALKPQLAWELQSVFVVP